MPKITYVGGFLPFLDPLNTIKSFYARFPTRFPKRLPTAFPIAFPIRISYKNFPQDFSTKITCKIFPQDFSELDPDCLAPNHPIQNAKFPPITALLNMPTYHKSVKVSPPPFPQILWEPQINEWADSKWASNKTRKSHAKCCD